MNGQTSVVMSFRYPPFLSRGANLRPGWGRDTVYFDGEPHRLRSSSNNPWIIRTTPGKHFVKVDGGPIVDELATEVEVRAGHVTLVEIFPPVNTILGPSKNVRLEGAIEWRILGPPPSI